MEGILTDRSPYSINTVNNHDWDTAVEHKFFSLQLCWQICFKIEHAPCHTMMPGSVECGEFREDRWPLFILCCFWICCGAFVIGSCVSPGTRMAIHHDTPIVNAWRCWTGSILPGVNNDLFGFVSFQDECLSHFITSQNDRWQLGEDILGEQLLVEQTPLGGGVQDPSVIRCNSQLRRVVLKP